MNYFYTLVLLTACYAMTAMGAEKLDVDHSVATINISDGVGVPNTDSPPDTVDPTEQLIKTFQAYNNYLYNTSYDTITEKEEEYIDKMKQLLAAGASPNVTCEIEDSDPMPLIFHVIYTQNDDLLELFLKYGANPKAQYHEEDGSIETALSYAALYSSYTAIVLLQKYGANPAGITLQVALKYKHVDVTRALVRHMPYLWRMHRRAKTLNSPWFNLLLAAETFRRRDAIESRAKK